VDCAQFSNPRDIGKSYYYTILTVDLRYGGISDGGTATAASIGSESFEDEDVVRMKEKGSSALSKVIVALALRDKQVPLSTGSLSYETAVQLCEKESVLVRHFAEAYQKIPEKAVHSVQL